MSQPFFLPGQVQGTRPRQPLLPVLFVFVMLAVFVGGLYWLRQFTASDETSPVVESESTVLQQPIPHALPDSIAEDLSIHLRNSTEASSEAIKILAQVEQRLTVIIRDLDAYQLASQKARVTRLHTLTQDALQKSRRATEEAQIAEKILENELKGEHQ